MNQNTNSELSRSEFLGTSALSAAGLSLAVLPSAASATEPLQGQARRGTVGEEEDGARERRCPNPDSVWGSS